MNLRPGCHLLFASLAIAVLCSAVEQASAQAFQQTTPAENDVRPADAARSGIAPKSGDLTFSRSGSEKNKTPMPDAKTPLLSWISSLCVVLGLFLLVAWLMRRASPRAYGILPGEVFESLGRAPLANRQQAHLIRFGNKLVLIAVSLGSSEPIAEITDPAEVKRLTELCRHEKPVAAVSSLSRMFRKKEKQDG